MTKKRNYRRSYRLTPGTRIMYRDGRYGTIVKFISPHNGYRVRMDERTNKFESDEIRVNGFDLTPLDMEERVVYEGAWPSFIRKERKWTGVI